MKKHFLYILLFFISINGYGQTKEPEDKNNELCFGAGISHNLEAYGLHFQYIRNIDQKNDLFGIGLGTEIIFDEHTHYSAGVIFQYTPIDHLSLSVSPGICINEGVYFATHLEVGYEFELKWLHIGPAVEIGHTSIETHYMLGIHTGFEF